MFNIIVVAEDGQQLGEIVEMLAGHGLTFEVQPPIKAVTRSVRMVREAIEREPRKVRADAGSNRQAAVNYVISPRVNIARIKAMSLTPQQREVALYVAKHGPASNAEIAEETGIGGKSVESAVYQLRHTTPVVIKSEQAN